MIMSIDSSAERSPKRRKRKPRAEISAPLQKAITKAAHQIRRAHDTELADVLKADRAGELFTSILRQNGTRGSAATEMSGRSGESVGLFADAMGGLVSDAIRGGTGLLEASLQFWTEEWLALMTTATKPNDERPSVADPTTHHDSLPSPATVLPPTSVEVTTPRDQPPEVTPPNLEEVRIQGILRQFMPMLAAAVRQGRNGYGLAETVIRLFGRRTYDEASGLGSDRIMQLIHADPDLRAQVAPIEGEFGRFLNEFTHYDTWTEEQNQQAK